MVAFCKEIWYNIRSDFSQSDFGGKKMGKKALLITSAAVLAALGLAASPLLFGKSKTTDKLSAYLKGTEKFTEKEVALLDMDGNGKIDRMDWIRAKYSAVFGSDSDVMQVYAPVVHRLYSIWLLVARPFRLPFVP